MTSSVASARNRNTRAARPAGRRQIRGKTAKRLRQIARALNLNPTTGYAPGGPLRRRPAGKVYGEDGELVVTPGRPIPRPGVLIECLRRAYKEAKKIYKGLPPSVLAPESEQRAQPAFKTQVAASVRKYYNAPN